MLGMRPWVYAFKILGLLDLIIADAKNILQ